MTNFISLIGVGDSKTMRSLLLVALAALSNTFALVLINEVAHEPERATLVMFAFFAAIALVSLISANRATRALITTVEDRLHQIKLRIVAKIDGSELAQIERVGRAEIFDRLSQNLGLVSIAGSMLVQTLQSLIVCVFMLAYVAWLSWITFAILTPLLIIGLYAFYLRGEALVALRGRQFTLRLHYLDRLMDILHGAKEIKLNRARARVVGRQYQEASADLGESSALSNFAWQDAILFLTDNMYVLLALLVFVLPVYVDFELGLVAQLVVAMLFISSNLQNALFYYALFADAEEALVRIRALERSLSADEPLVGDELSGPSRAQHVRPWSGPVASIELVDVEFSYPARGAEPGFHLGPIDLRAEPGKLLFIVGGNGAGKSTLLKLLTGLYAPASGELRAGGVAVTPANIASYRELLSVIFTDVHLFARAYGLLDADPGAVEEFLVQMKIEHKTEFANGRFSNIKLSTGQRKRLALVIALLEDRPILILDEWAADQDPEFRAHFYEVLLPSLERRGKIVIVVSHDDRYFHCADRVVELELGKVRDLDL